MKLRRGSKFSSSCRLGILTPDDDAILWSLDLGTQMHQETLSGAKPCFPLVPLGRRWAVKYVRQSSSAESGLGQMEETCPTEKEDTEMIALQR